MDVGPGDKVVCIDAGTDGFNRSTGQFLRVGQVYTVEACARTPEGIPVVRLAECDHFAIDRWCRDRGAWHIGFHVSRFRKHRDISEWLATATDFEEPKRIATPRESA